MSLLNVGVSALNANQAALQTTGHNIANANTAGYSRQTVVLQTIAGQNRGNGYIGNGVSAAAVMRNYSELLNKQSAAASAAGAADAARSQSLNQMQDIFSGGDAGMGAAINNMMNAFADLQTSPMDSSARNVVLTRMAELATRFRASSASLDEQDYTTRQQITNNITVVNSLASQVATLNTQISRAFATGHIPNDLLDQRDQLIRDINQHVKTTQVAADDGSINLFVGGSQALVLGSSTAQLSVNTTAEYPGSGKLSLYFNQPGGQAVELTADMVSGGEVAGLLKFNNDDLVEGRNQLGRLAMAITSELNKQNQRGLTLSGEQGKDLFKPTTDLASSGRYVLAGYSNISGYDAGIPSASVSFTDTQKLVASDYKVVFGKVHPADTTLVRLSDGLVRKLGDLSYPLAPPPSPAPTAGSASFYADGLTFSLDAAAQSGSYGQSILFRPFSKAANDFQGIVYNPDDLAVASSVSAALKPNSNGDSSLQLVQLRVEAGHQLALNPAPPFTLTFNEVGGNLFYSHPGIPNTPYKVGEPIKIPVTPAANDIDGNPIIAWQITLAGTPNDGETVEIRNAKDTVLGDSWKRNSGNASAFLALRDAKIFDNGTTLTDGFSGVMAVVGTRAQSAQYAANLSASVAASLEAERTAVSGVNLDEEAARLLQFQQSYQASAKVIQIAQSLFDSVLNAVNH